MKKITYLLSFLLFWSFTSHAQKGLRKEKIKAYKIAYLTDELDLSAEEAEKFWPVYNTFENEMFALRFEEKHKIKKQIEQNGGLDSLTEKEAKEMVLKMHAVKSKMHKIITDFQQKLPEILPYKKIVKLNIAETKFHRKLIRKLKNKREK